MTKELEVSNLLFVYGTLQTGRGNNDLLAGATSLGQKVTRNNYLLSFGGVPFMTPDWLFDLSEEEKVLFRPVVGELFEIDEDHMRHCDWLEGHPGGYTRKIIYTTEGDTCWCYLWLHNVRQHHDIASVNEEGNYKW